jgi:hypothetical protein
MGVVEDSYRAPILNSAFDRCRCCIAEYIATTYISLKGRSPKSYACIGIEFLDDSTPLHNSVPLDNPTTLDNPTPLTPPQHWTTLHHCEHTQYPHCMTAPSKVYCAAGQQVMTQSQLQCPCTCLPQDITLDMEHSFHHSTTAPLRTLPVPMYIQEKTTVHLRSQLIANTANAKLKCSHH